jgi:hypothetical protein
VLDVLTESDYAEAAHAYRAKHQLRRMTGALDSMLEPLRVALERYNDTHFPKLSPGSMAASIAAALVEPSWYALGPERTRFMAEYLAQQGFLRTHKGVLFVVGFRLESGGEQLALGRVAMRVPGIRPSEVWILEHHVPPLDAYSLPRIAAELQPGLRDQIHKAGNPAFAAELARSSAQTQASPRRAAG